MSIFEDLEVGDIVEIGTKHITGLEIVRRGRPSRETYQLPPGTRPGMVVHKELRAYPKEHHDPKVKGVFLKYGYGHEVHFLVNDVVVLIKESLLQAGLEFKIVQKGKHHGEPGHRRGT